MATVTDKDREAHDKFLRGEALALDLIAQAREEGRQEERAKILARLRDLPELNMNNYDEDQVRVLNDGVGDVILSLSD